jgi:hypothetical protein
MRHVAPKVQGKLSSSFNTLVFIMVHVPEASNPQPACNHLSLSVAWWYNSRLPRFSRAEPWEFLNLSQETKTNGKKSESVLLH